MPTISVRWSRWRPAESAFDYQFTAMGAELELGTFCHENGHMLCDYPDLYDYGSESSGVGAYCLMCAGNNASEKNPIAVNAYLKRLSGWARTVTPLEHDRTVTLNADTNDFAIYSRSGREYFLIENRRRTGRDAALPDEGLAIWHVDEDGDNSHEHMTGAKHYELSLEQADGLFQLERLRNQMGDGNDLFAGAGARFGDGTVPSSRWWNGTASNLTIDQVTAAGASMTFRCLLSDTVAPPHTLNPVSIPNRPIPDNNPSGISDTIAISDALTISSIKVAVDITHTYRGDLRVSLITPWGVTIELHPKGRGGSADDLKVTFDETTVPALATLRGRNTQGAWQLRVQDLAPADGGRLNRWSLAISSAAPAVAPIDLQESPGVPIPDAPHAGIERVLATASAGRVGNVEVSVDISHTWIGDLLVSLVSPAGTEVPLHNRSGGSSDNLVRTFTSANTPPMAALVGQASGRDVAIEDRRRRDAGCGQTQSVAPPRQTTGVRRLHEQLARSNATRQPSRVRSGTEPGGRAYQPAGVTKRSVPSPTPLSMRQPHLLGLPSYDRAASSSLRSGYWLRALLTSAAGGRSKNATSGQLAESVGLLPNVAI